MDVKKLKFAVQQLPRVDRLVDSINRHIKQPALHKPLKELAYGQVINDKLASFAHNIVDLKIASVINDKKKAQRIINSLLRDPHSSVRQLLADVHAFDSQVSLFHDSYHRLIEEMLRSMPLEDAVVLLDSSHVRELQQIPKQQKEYVRLLGKHFVDMAKGMKK